MKAKRAGIVLLSLIILGGFFVPNASAEKPVKIAVASEGKSMDSQVSKLGGRCSWFLFFDEEGTLEETVKNPYQKGSQAGIKSTKFLKSHKVTVFVAEKIGEKMREAIESGDIDFVFFSGTVQEAVNEAISTVNSGL